MVAKLNTIVSTLKKKTFSLHEKANATASLNTSKEALEVYYIQRAKELKFTTFDVNEDVFNRDFIMVTNLPTQQQALIYLNDLFLVQNKQSGKQILLIHYFNKVNLHKVIEQIQFDDIQFASQKAMQMFIKKQNKIGKEINEDIGAGEYILALLEKARVSSVSDIYISLIGMSLMIQYRASLGIEDVGRFGVKEAQIVRNTLEFLAHVENGTQWYDSKITVDKQEYRINFIETAQGYTATIRSYANHEFSDSSLQGLGYTPKVIKIINSITSNQNGMILYTAQTGQGKTTTQNTNLAELAKKGLRVVSVENPVEQRLNLVNQVDLSIYETAEDKFKLTAKTAVKLFLRAKPDVINMGEIRDGDDAQLAYQASVTGHLVFATYHTNSVLTAITRLKNEAKLSESDIKAVMRGIVYQYLARQLCPHCKQKTDEKGHFKAKKNGCSMCDYSGYKKLRTPVVEIAQFYHAKEFDLYDSKTYMNYISLEESAKEKYDLGLIDLVHLNAILNGEREPELDLNKSPKKLAS